MTFHTVDTLRAGRRRLEKRVGRIEKADRVSEMRAGAAYTYSTRSRAHAGSCQTAAQVSDDIAKLVVASSDVVSANDALFGCAAQTWRWWREVE